MKLIILFFSYFISYVVIINCWFWVCHKRPPISLCFWYTYIFIYSPSNQNNKFLITLLFSFFGIVCCKCLFVCFMRLRVNNCLQKKGKLHLLFSLQFLHFFQDLSASDPFGLWQKMLVLMICICYINMSWNRNLKKGFISRSFRGLMLR